MSQNRDLIRTQLRDLYSREMPRIEAVRERCDTGKSEGKLEGPFLACPPMTYATAVPRILIVGQETHGWALSNNVEIQMTSCIDFMTNGSKKYPGPFWGMIKKIESMHGYQDRSVAWSNLNRFDRAGKPPSSADLELLTGLDDLLVSEIAILKPNLIIFFTGPRYIDRIGKILPGKWTAPKGFKERQLSLMSADGRTYIRTYHPNYLRRSGLEPKVISFIETLKGGNKASA
jgi:hypothetical protein